MSTIIVYVGQVQHEVPNSPLLEKLVALDEALASVDTFFYNDDASGATDDVLPQKARKIIEELLADEVAKAQGQ
jgi:hypothetical protein